MFLALGKKAPAKLNTILPPTPEITGEELVGLGNHLLVNEAA